MSRCAPRSRAWAATSASSSRASAGSSRTSRTSAASRIRCGESAGTLAPSRRRVSPRGRWSPRCSRSGGGLRWFVTRTARARTGRRSARRRQLPEAARLLGAYVSRAAALRRAGRRAGRPRTDGAGTRSFVRRLGAISIAAAIANPAARVIAPPDSSPGARRRRCRVRRAAERSRSHATPFVILRRGARRGRERAARPARGRLGSCPAPRRRRDGLTAGSGARPRRRAGLLERRARRSRRRRPGARRPQTRRCPRAGRRSGPGRSG